MVIVFAIYTNIKSGCTTETNTILHVNYISIKKSLLRQMITSHMKHKAFLLKEQDVYSIFEIILLNVL